MGEVKLLLQKGVSIIGKDDFENGMKQTTQEVKHISLSVIFNMKEFTH